MTTVTRKPVYIRHPYLDPHVVIETGEISIDMCSDEPVTPEGLAAIADLGVSVAQFEEAVKAQTAEHVVRDLRVQAGRPKLRGSHMPQLDAWLVEKIKVDPKIRNDALWDALPRAPLNSILHCTGSIVRERVSGRYRAVTRAGFDKRVTKARAIRR